MSLQKELMTWESVGNGRWAKKYRSKRHRVGVKQLHTVYPDLVKTISRAGTRAAANHWWTDKQRNLRMSETSDGMVILRIEATKNRELFLLLQDRAHVFADAALKTQ